jgi:hypothetical protein
VTLGDFLGSTGRSTVPLGPFVDNSAGTVRYGALSFGAPAGPDGSGTVATVVLRALTSDYSLPEVDAQFTDSAGRRKAVESLKH